MDHIEPRCCFDAGQYTGTPDSSPCPCSMYIPALVNRLDALYASGKEDEAGELIGRSLETARAAGDWRSELSLLAELSGHCRRSGERDRALEGIERIYEILKEHNMGSTVSGATVLLNAATTLKCFGLAEKSIPVFRHVSRVYSSALDPHDYRFAGLYNNMALSCADVGDFHEAEKLFRAAIKVISHCEHPENETAVSLCNLAELYYKQDAEDERVNDCMEEAWSCLNAPSLPRDGYHAFTVSKCAPTFDYFGFFLYARELKERAEKIYALS